MSKKLVVRTLLVAVVAACIWSFVHRNLGHYLTLEYVKSQQDVFASYYSENKALTIGAYLGIYILSTALSLPGATILTLAGGALFGLGLGTVLVSFASTFGATLAFLVARFLLRDFVQTRFGDKLTAINEGIRKDGAFYLFTLRLLPVFPFFVINLVMGLTSLRALQFFFVSQLGMLPGTMVYVNAGKQLGRLESLKGILSPGLLLSFALLGLFPLVAKAVVNRVKSQKYLRRFKKPKRFDCNIVVVGAGSGGLVSAYIAAAVRARVVLIEKHKMGGDCLNTGCVPSKALIRSAKILSYIRRHKEFGIREASANFEFAEVMERVQRVIRKVAPHDSVQRYTDLGVECIAGEAKIVSPYEVRVNGNTITTKNIVIATGGRPAAPPVKGIEKIKFLDSDSVWGLRVRPANLLVLGAGPIGCELAQCFQRLGSNVTMVQRGTHILPREDKEAADVVHASFKKDGVNVLLNHEAKEFVVENGKKYLVCEHGASQTKVEFDEVVGALGRKAYVKGFGLEELDVRITKQGTVAVDPFLRTNYPNIFAVGDVTGPYQFTHTAAHQAWYVAVNALFGPLRMYKADYRVIPWCTFTDPEVARVGLSETEAKERGIPYEVTVYGLDDLDRAIADEEDHGFVKVLTPPGKDQILGAMIVGAHAGDYLVEFVAAMKHGFGLNKILGTIHIYPTLAEANKYAAGNWKKAHAPDGALRWLQRFHQWRRGGTPNFVPHVESNEAIPLKKTAGHR